MTDTPAPSEHLRIPTDQLRWTCDESCLNFETTAEVTPIEGVIGQDDAVAALSYGLEIDAPGQNIFVRGLVGTGRLTLVSRVLGQIQPRRKPTPDLCYVHNFAHSEQPRILELPRGKGKLFRRRIGELAEYIRRELSPALSTDELRDQQTALEEKLQKELEKIGGPFEKELAEHGLTLVAMQAQGTSKHAILPLHEGEPMPAEKLAQLQQEGKISEEDARKIRDTVIEYARRFQALGEDIQETREEHRVALHQLYEWESRRILRHQVHDIEAAFPQERVGIFLGEVIDDVVERRLAGQEPGAEIDLLYRVNVILEHAADDPCPIVVENTPTLANLLGSIGRKVLPEGMVYSDHTMITAGSLLRANGGYLVLEARDVLTEPGAWKLLMRTLRTGKLEIVPHDASWFGMGVQLKPEPIDLSVKVVLLGDPYLHHALDSQDPDFANLFKVLADFDSSIPRDERGLEFYAGVLARIAAREGLLPFTRGGVAALAEHGARIAARRDRLTTRFGRLVDLAREAEFLARKAEQEAVTGDLVFEAVRRSKQRADLPARHFRRMVQEGVIRIQTSGRIVGQINGLAVTQSGPLTYGFPARITGTIGPGTRGAVNIEREAQLSGSIHTKGFYILGGLLRHLVRTIHPLAFSASIAFEQSYGGIDGDSASGAEICCLLSALTDVPLRQDLAMTGAIDQHGHVQAIGAVSEKVEGFFDTCRQAEASRGGWTGTQGVIIPRSNLIDLQLRRDVVEACDRGEFHVYAVDRITEALELFTGLPAGSLDEEGDYPEGTLLHAAVEKAWEFWEMASGRAFGAEEEEVEEEAGAEAGAEEEKTEEEADPA